ncbi:MAG: hypothetical protein QF704_11150, partial [Anaerolineales bacterium]|nr:hypothetical protein [Anaerolineales bacterium]
MCQINKDVLSIEVPEYPANLRYISGRDGYFRFQNTLISLGYSKPPVYIGGSSLCLINSTNELISVFWIAFSEFMFESICLDMRS